MNRGIQSISGKIALAVRNLFEAWMRRMLPPSADEIIAWRQRNVLLILLCGLVIGSVSYASTMLLSFRLQQWNVMLLYTALYLWIFIVTLVPRLPSWMRIFTVLSMSYIFGLSRLVVSGPAGSGRVWFFAFVFFATMVWGFRAGLIAWAISLLTLGVFTVLLWRGILDWQAMAYSPDLWLTTVVTLAFLSLLVVASLSMLMQRLEQSLRQARVTNVRLETEVAERRQAEAALFRRTTQLEALRQSGLLVSAELDLRSLLQSIAAQAARLLGGNGGVVHLYRPDLDALEWIVAAYSDMHEVEPDLLRLGMLLNRGEGLAGRIWQTGESLVVDDYTTWEGRAAVYEGYPLRSVVGVPIQWGSEFLGVVSVNAHEACAFSSDDGAVLSLFAVQAATAIRNARLYEQVQTTARQMQALYETTRALSSSLREEDVIRTILQAIYQVLGCEHVILSQVDEAAGTIGIRHGFWQGEFDAFPEWIRQAQYPLNHSDIVPDVYRTGRTEIISGWDERFNKEIWSTFGHSRFFRAFVPVKLGNRVIGVVEVAYDKDRKKSLSDQEFALLNAFIDQAAVALENARAFQAVQTSERAVRESEQMLRLIFDNAFDGISIHQESRDSVRVLLYCNDRYVEMSGRDRQELLSIADTRYFQTHMEQDQTAYGRALQAGHPYSGLFSWQRPDGRENVIAYTAVPVTVAEDILIVGIDRDITEQRRADRERRELRDRLERAERMEALGMLAGGVAHDLNNILGPLVAYPDLILMDLPPDSLIRPDVEQIKQSAQRAAAVVQDLLTLARRGAYQMEPLNLNHMVQEYTRSLPLVELKARNPTVRVEVSLAQDLFNVKGSTAHLTKVLMNLVINAYEAMPYGGQLEINTTCESLDQPLAGYEQIEAGDYVVLRVCDTGIGIAQEDLRHIFEPFYTKKAMGRSGSGLGLAVVWGVMHDHRGAIDVHTVLGQGTEFALYFPVTREQIEVEEKMQYDYRGTESVLVIDDLAVQREIAIRLLALLGYHVAAVESGCAALDYLSQHKADILVLDMILDDKTDGLDVYRAILERYPGQKAIIASGFSETDRVKEAQQLGAGIFVKKPYTLERLGRAIRNELDR
ncbi:MAG: GAF domain-containing protein [Anaerolineae bacterium]|nr:GAF domain-containing protein [Anaerolineae bacterium]